MAHAFNQTHAKLAMQKAWRIARRGWAIYGGSVREYFSEALRIAWKEIKEHPVTQAAEDLVARMRALRGKPSPLADHLSFYAGSQKRWQPHTSGFYGTR